MAIYFLGCVAHALYTPLVPRLNRGESPIAFSFRGAGGGDGDDPWWPGGSRSGHGLGQSAAIVWITIGYTAAMATA